MPYCAYLRKSRADLEAEAHGEGETLARHERTLRDTARRQRLPIDVFYREIVSGESIAARPVVQQLLREVEGGRWDGVFVVEVERLARGDTIDQGVVSRAFSYSNTKIITPLKTYDPSNEFDEEYFEFGLFMSRREYKTIRRRMIAGCQAAVREGKFAGKQAPFGYRRVKLEHEKGWTLEIVEEEAGIVREIYRLYLLGSGYRRIAAELIARGIAAPRQKTWSEYSVRHILRNATYAGRLRWGERPVKKKVADGAVRESRPLGQGYIEAQGRHVAIVPEETYLAVQQRMEQSRSAPIPGQHTLRNPFRGLMYCSACGSAMQLHPYPALGTASLECRTVRCGTVSSRLPVAEHAMLEMLQGWFSGYEVWVEGAPEEKRPERTAQEQAVARIQKELLTVEDQQLRAQELVEQRVYTAQEFIRRRQTLEERREALQTALREQEAMLEALERTENVRIEPHAAPMVDAYQNASAEDKNLLLRLLVDKIEYVRPARRDALTLRVFPRLPPAPP